MAISIDWATRVITVPQADLTFLGGNVYELDVNQLRLWIKDLEDDPDGMPFPDVTRHNTEVELSGVTYARTIEFINNYTIEFEDGQYIVNLFGANHNVLDVKVFNQVSVLVNNSAGLIVSGSGVTQQDKEDIAELTANKTVDPSNPVSIRQALFAILATATGLASGGGTAAITFRDHGNTADAVEMTVDENGNRTAVTITFPPYT